MKYIYLLSSLIIFSACSKTTSQKPNIIFIMADDHAVQAISAYKHPLTHLAPTPNIDRLAKNGAIFQNSFCTNSICGPSRAVILTGKHSHINGFRQNGDIFDGSQPTLPKQLQQLGYQTSIIGKWHLHGYPQGFDYWDILNDQGNYYNPDFIHMSDTNALNQDIDKINNTAHWTTDKGDTSRIIGYTTDLITDKAINWLNTKRKKSGPFFLMVHHKAPHRNWMPAPRHLNKYDTVQFPLPATYFSKHNNQLAAQQQQQTIYKDMYEGHDLKMTKCLGCKTLAHNPWKTDFKRMTPEQRANWDKAYQGKNDAFHNAHLEGDDLAKWKGQRYLQDYLATIASVDESVGRILDYLEEEGLAENTLVVYTSDQGFYLGEKGWFDKRFMYEESLRMPLLMQYPAAIKAGTVVKAMVQNLDFAPTFLDFAGGKSFAKDMQGQSFKTVLTGDTSEKEFRDLIYYHYYDYPAFHMVKKHYGIRNHRYKLMHFYDDIDTWEFYDLQQDPNELYNAIDDKAYQPLIKTMRHQLDSIQTYYQVTDKEFVRAPKKKVENAFKQFKKLRGIK